MNDKELIKRARKCATDGGDCEGCPFDEKDPCEDWRANGLLSALADRLEELHGG